MGTGHSQPADGLVLLLRCLETGSRLQLADAPTLSRVNQTIVEGRLVDRLGQRVERPLDGGLVNGEQTWLYPVCDGIPQMLLDEAISLTQEGLSG